MRYFKLTVCIVFVAVVASSFSQQAQAQRRGLFGRRLGPVFQTRTCYGDACRTSSYAASYSEYAPSQCLGNSCPIATEPEPCQAVERIETVAPEPCAPCEDVAEPACTPCEPAQTACDGTVCTTCDRSLTVRVAERACPVRTAVTAITQTVDSTVERVVSLACGLRGGASLRLDAGLCAMAARNSVLQARYNRCGHFAGNNCWEIATPGATADEAIRLWLGSPEHCQTLLDRRFTAVGAASSVSASGVRYWTMCFR